MNETGETDCIVECGAENGGVRTEEEVNEDDCVGHGDGVVNGAGHGDAVNESDATYSIDIGWQHRKNGQFASRKGIYKEGLSADASWDPAQSCLQGDSTPRPETVEKSTPAMRRGPAGPRSLCNACGLMWANKGTLRDLTKAGRNISFDQSEPDTPVDIKPITMGTEIPSGNHDEQETPEDLFKAGTDETENPSVKPDEEDLQETAEDLTNPLPTGIENSSVNFEEQEILNEFANASQAEIEIPSYLDHQVKAIDPHMGSDGRGLNITSNGNDIEP
ncbi:hypothetical protein HHK36_008190 [Tetracentron sinense]|uniref:GATA-type domain-containing protein n=1 Tax=Tetracentron sinense TaxID=13715 RepID=A0A834ZI00_TETSI|nr:hypothetical protein HHK36_008190 [Tetracentron sinense]